MIDQSKLKLNIKFFIFAMVAICLAVTAGYNQELAVQSGYIPPIALWNVLPLPNCPIGSNFFC